MRAASTRLDLRHKKSRRRRVGSLSIVTAIAVEAADSLTEAEVADLYDSVGWAAYTTDLSRLMAGLRGSHRVVTARRGGQLIGLARSISDGATIVYVQDILVRPDHQRGGVGRRLTTELLSDYEDVRQQVLIADDEDRQRLFYESLGFTEVHDMRPEVRAFVRFH